MFKLPPPQNDGLYTPAVGSQSRDKHYILMRYIDIFTTSMKDKWKLHYIDLFAGAGIEKVKGDRELHWGSPMIAAQAPKPFDRLHLCEINQRKYEALKQRVTQIRSDSQLLKGDANTKVVEVAEQIPRGSLSLVFLNPYGLQVDFTMLKLLAGKKADMIIFFPDRLDIIRNWRHYYKDPNSGLDRYLGGDCNWRSILDNAPPNSRIQALRELYVRQLKTKLGYSQVEYKRIPMSGPPLYYLVFCSHSEIGARFWREISRKERSGQQTFRFD